MREAAGDARWSGPRADRVRAGWGYTRYNKVGFAATLAGCPCIAISWRHMNQRLEQIFADVGHDAAKTRAVVFATCCGGAAETVSEPRPIVLVVVSLRGVGF